MSKSEEAFDNQLHRELKKATRTEKKETKMKDTVTVNKIKYNTMKYALYTLVIVGLVFVGRNWGYSDHQSEVNKITAQLKTQQ